MKRKKETKEQGGETFDYGLNFTKRPEKEEKKEKNKFA